MSKGRLPTLAAAMKGKGNRNLSLGARTKGTGAKQAANAGLAKPKDGDKLWRRKP